LIFRYGDKQNEEGTDRISETYIWYRVFKYRHNYKYHEIKRRIIRMPFGFFGFVFIGVQYS